MVTEEKGMFGMTDLKAFAEVLGNGGMGSAFKAVLANGLVLAVKRMRAFDRFETKDAFDGEMRKLASKFPSQCLASTKNGTGVVRWVVSAIGEKREAGLIDYEMMTKSVGCWKSVVKLLHIGVACTEPDPGTRPGLSEVRERIEKVEVEEDGGHSSQDNTGHVKFILPSGARDNFGVC
ncbi:hypothetical protein Cgig2_025194 [Carnegiea gigantea]|uniref:Uncharacterized protein n=1 Tax=Carnegiea gigantea TaxID=171969 RepID=A0A9Q1KSI5_9CARY|nr:hypothetical protein Cgig2_025194 [Carnegiea gigantea]